MLSISPVYLSSRNALLSNTNNILIKTTTRSISWPKFLRKESWMESIYTDWPTKQEMWSGSPSELATTKMPGIYCWKSETN